MKPNDGKCHLDQRGKTYTEGLVQDYPSLGLVSRLARENSMNVIFAVTQKVADAYRQIARMVSEFTVGVLASDSSNIIDLVKDQYKVLYIIHL